MQAAPRLPWTEGGASAAPGGLEIAGSAQSHAVTTTLGAASEASACLTPRPEAEGIGSGGRRSVPPAPAQLPSAGSSAHAEGACRPCAYVRSTVGCRFDSSCGFCHVAEHEARARPCKGKRERLKRTMLVIEGRLVDDPGLLHRGGLRLPASIDRSPRARARMMDHLECLAAEAMSASAPQGAVV